MIADLAARTDSTNGPTLLVGNGKSGALVVVSADRGLCGGFNGGIIRATRREVDRLQAEGKSPKLLMVGRKAADALRREFGTLFIDTLDIRVAQVSFNDALTISTRIREMIEDGSVDTCAIVYNKFVSAITGSDLWLACTG